MKLGQGYIFRGVCHSVNGGGLLLGGLGVWSWWGVWSQGGLVPGGLVRGGGVCAWGKPPEIATAVGGMHPTGMHSC